MAAALWPRTFSFPSEHSNYLCETNSPLVRTRLPCASPWDDWQTPLKDEFVIAGWWPPTNNVIHQYKAAHFNLVLTGNVAQGCQRNGTLRMGASSSEAFDCVIDFLPEWNGKLGLK